MENTELINPMAQPVIPGLAPFYDERGFSIDRYHHYLVALRNDSPRLCAEVRAAGWTNEAIWQKINSLTGRLAKLELAKDLWQEHDRYVQELIAAGRVEEAVWPDFRAVTRRINDENPIGSPIWFLNHYLTEKSSRMNLQQLNAVLATSLDNSRDFNEVLQQQPARPQAAAPGEEPAVDSLLELEFRRIVRIAVLREGVRNMLSECTRKKQFVEICKLIIRRKQLTYNEMKRKENIEPLMKMSRLTTSYDRVQRAVSEGCRDLDEE